MAEVMPANSFVIPKIDKIPKYGQPPDFGSETGYALVVVKLDKGRSLSNLDYVLSDGSSEYPCLAISDTDGVYDVSDWEKKKGCPDQKYQMLFKVRMPTIGKPKYVLKFNLRPGVGRDPDLTFVNVKDKRFTKMAKIPDGGMLGVDPYAPKPKPKPKPKVSAGKGKSGAAASNNASSKTSKAKKGASKQGGKKKIDEKAKKWEEMLRKSLEKKE